MFCEIQDRLSDPNIRHVFSYCLFDQSSEGIDKALKKYDGEQFFGWIENDELKGVCGYRVLQDKIEICHIAVTDNARGCGYGSAMVIALCDKYGMDIQAETDDDAVDFYKKCGFETTALYKQYGDDKFRRWICVLPIKKAKEDGSI